jgi:hypothetical protein
MDLNQTVIFSSFPEILLTTQSINQSYFGNPVAGDSKSALDSIYSIFKTTREIVTIYGDDGKQLAGLAFKMLN